MEPNRGKLERSSDARSTEAAGGAGPSPDEKRPRLLFLAYFFPPVRAIASVRAYSIAKSLARSGWDVTVVTPRASVWRRKDGAEEVDRTLEREGIHCLRTRHPWRSLASGHVVPLYEHTGPLGKRIGDRLAGWARRAARRLDFPGEFGWIRAAERACFRLRTGETDLILATGSPFTAFAAARRISRRLNCPYVLDYRDLWSGNPYVDPASPAGDVAEERQVLADSAAVIAVSPGIERALHKSFGIGSKVCTIMNGYDSEELAGIPAHRFDHFAIVYAGNFFPPKRTVNPLMAALARLKAAGPSPLGPWAFHYYGRTVDHVREAASQWGVEDRVLLHGEVPRREALAAVGGAGMAVVISSVVPRATLEDEGVVTGKVFEAIGQRTPVLAIAPPGSDLEGILATAGLGRRFSGDEIEGMASYLAEAIRGRTRAANEPEAFDWTRVGRRLDLLLRQVVGSGVGRSEEGARDAAGPISA